MGTRDPRFDAYIAKSADFAQPILTHLREIVHEACPQVEETLKWSAPHFTYKGMLCHMAAFKAHCAFGFWKGALVLGEHVENSHAAAQFGRITSVKDLPPRKVIAGYVKKAMALNEAGVQAPFVAERAAKRGTKPDLEVPADLLAALGDNAPARATFDGFSPSHRREYVEWILEAKSDATRQRRLETAVAQMAEGKSRHWKYARA